MKENNAAMKKVIVVGAGIAGMTAAIYARRSGFDVTLIEQHSIAGGMCTSWRRKGYLFEGAIHWLIGSSHKTDAHELWKDTGALGDDVRVFLPDPFHSVEHEGQVLSLYRSVEKTAEHLRVVSPEDVPRLHQLVKDVKALSKMQMPIMDIKGVKAENPKRMSSGFAMTMMSLLPTISRLSKLSCRDFAARFKHPGIQKLLNLLPEGYDASSFVITLASLDAGDGGYPEGGSLAMADRMAQTFTDMGGTLIMKAKVQKVNIKDGKATGVTLESGTLDADAVIVTQETIAALDNLFDVPIGDKWLHELRAEAKPVLCTFVGVGIKAEIPKTPVWELKEPIHYAGQTITSLGLYNYAEYEGYAPEGGTALTTAFISDTYDFWKQAKADGRYEQEKQSLAEQISKAICRRYPQAVGKIEVIDIATPLTYERYTSAYRGSWMILKEPGDKMKRYPGHSENVNGLYFAGHRLMSPGGLPVALISGRQAAQLVCRQFGEVFR
ncbi:MAG: NAD(P)/FAD-dependent oxidoreductase [Clostridiales bacterium]|nr:NAD(P)/FAD-dependent oxidoreductase [Clostridiales bacterium]